MVAAIVVVSAAAALAWVFFVPILEAPDETVHFEYATALYSAGGLVAPRDVARLTVPDRRSVPYPKYLEDQSAVAVIAEKPDVKAPAGFADRLLAHVGMADSYAPFETVLGTVGIGLGAFLFGAAIARLHDRRIAAMRIVPLVARGHAALGLAMEF